MLEGNITVCTSILIIGAPNRGTRNRKNSGAFAKTGDGLELGAHEPGG